MEQAKSKLHEILGEIYIIEQIDPSAYDELEEKVRASLGIVQIYGSTISKELSAKLAELASAGATNARISGDLVTQSKNLAEYGKYAEMTAAKFLQMELRSTELTLELLRSGAISNNAAARILAGGTDEFTDITGALVREIWTVSPDGTRVLLPAVDKVASVSPYLERISQFAFHASEGVS